MATEQLEAFTNQHAEVQKFEHNSQTNVKLILISHVK